MNQGKKLLKKYNLFVFDWDGTLSEMHAVLKLNESLKRQFGTWNRKAKIKQIEAERKKTLKRDIEIEETKNEFIVPIFEVLAIFYKPRLHRDVTEMLAFLKRKHKKMAILSNGNSSRLSKELEKMKIRKYFDLVVSAKDIGAIKPDPRGLKAIISRMKAKPSHTIYFGDMIDDVLTADLAKVDSAAISDGFDSHAKLSSAGPKYLFKSVEQMLFEMDSKAK